MGSGSDSENEIRSTLKTGKDTEKMKEKISRHFAYDLIRSASETSWEPQELASLIMLVSNQLQFSHRRLLKCFTSTMTGVPAVIVIFIDNGHAFTPRELIDMFMTEAGSINGFISYVAEAMECNIFDLNLTEVLQELVNVVEENDLDFNDAQRYAQAICEHCSSKRKVGKVLSYFTSRYTEEEASSFIHDVITLDFFMDVNGTMESFFSPLKRVRERVKALLNAGNRLNGRGEIVDSDEDDEGNLKGFVVGEDDDDVSSADSASASDEESIKSSDSEGEGGKKRRKRKHKRDKKEHRKASKKSKKSRKVVIGSDDEDGDADIAARDKGKKQLQKQKKRAMRVPDDEDEDDMAVDESAGGSVGENKEDSEEEEEEEFSDWETSGVEQSAEIKEKETKGAKGIDQKRMSKSSSKDRNGGGNSASARSFAASVRPCDLVDSSPIKKKRSRLVVQESDNDGSDEYEDDGDEGKKSELGSVRSGIAPESGSDGESSSIGNSSASSSEKGTADKRRRSLAESKVAAKKSTTASTAGAQKKTISDSSDSDASSSASSDSDGNSNKSSIAGSSSPSSSGSESDSDDSDSDSGGEKAVQVHIDGDEGEGEKGTHFDINRDNSSDSSSSDDDDDSDDGGIPSDGVEDEY